jgi:serine-type D-Ala-D-Ala carboxypeptidase (penicillin-binding protein 5/6)
LILGMIVQSGNDATIALAERIAGTEETFVQLMNSNAQRLGMAGTHFENSSGLPSRSTTRPRATCRCSPAPDPRFPAVLQMVLGARIRVQRHQAAEPQRPAEQDPSVDGLKTGHTDSAGFCLVTSLRDGMRLCRWCSARRA